ncbi:MAG: hypothetical protein BroJett030_17470 [Alphaproteobacteria bacterium]|nr:MAG: hypothetical protein BroJett030_17470 [Alphaproteobacteria bacterium]
MASTAAAADRANSGRPRISAISAGRIKAAFLPYRFNPMIDEYHASSGTAKDYNLTVVGLPSDRCRPMA